MASWSRSSAEAGHPPRLASWRVLAFAVVAPLLLRVKLPRLARWLEPPPPLPPPPAPAEIAALVARIDRLLAAGRPLVRRGCLTRGLTLYRFLRRAGADVALCFGVGRRDGDLAGHCWIEHGGAPLAERRDPRGLYVETYRISGGMPGGAGPEASPSDSPTAGEPSPVGERSPVPGRRRLRREPPGRRAARSRLP